LPTHLSCFGRLPVSGFSIFSLDFPSSTLSTTLVIMALSDALRQWLGTHLPALGITDDDVSEYILALATDDDSSFDERAEAISAYLSAAVADVDGVCACVCSFNHKAIPVY
jgi:hypothetical protein